MSKPRQEDNCDPGCEDNQGSWHRALHSCPAQARATQADKLGSQQPLSFNLILFFHTGSRGWCYPTLTPLALTVPRVVRPQIVRTYSQGRKKALLMVCWGRAPSHEPG